MDAKVMGLCHLLAQQERTDAIKREERNLARRASRKTDKEWQQLQLVVGMKTALQRIVNTINEQERMGIRHYLRAAQS